ncbi:ABC transporter permease [Bradyrhizobium sp. LHD-71]|uniref:ABC transporter permease n=1 Tax=Bradyrhizobium sp. LHD-71 TaxID=3072141 RepID=UPI0028100190|nr:ABC transporter permease [Bradyrhizobium sp. LHD-71]MDQ8731583.1 ABC transporter permease [Bradyrhizobium sp. LHD-71]
MSSGRIQFLLGRLLKSILVLLAVVVLNFTILRLAPGDPALILAGEQGAADAAFVDQIRKDFGLDRSVPEQLAVYIKSLATFDLGLSFRERRPIATIIGERLPATLILTLTAFALSLLIGIPLGALAARRPHGMVDVALTTVSTAFFAMPLFWTGLLAIIFFSVWLNWLPSYGMMTVGAPLSGLAAFLDLVKHLALPASTLALFYISIYLRITRAAVLDVMGSDYVRTARAIGLPPTRIWREHILRNALLPVITFASLQAGHLIGGSIVIETVFAWPGIGRLAFDALLQRDYNLLLSVFFVSSVVVMAFNFLADALYVLVDPRIEAGASA